VSGPNAKYGPIARGIRRDMSEKGWVPLRYWVIWWSALGVAMVLFYVVLTPLWLGLRAAAWVAELRSRLQPPGVRLQSDTRSSRSSASTHEEPMYD
jgi:hypothetical protein